MQCWFPDPIYPVGICDDKWLGYLVCIGKILVEKWNNSYQFYFHIKFFEFKNQVTLLFWNFRSSNQVWSLEWHPKHTDVVEAEMFYVAGDSPKLSRKIIKVVD